LKAAAMVSPSADDAEFTYSGTELDALADAVNYYTEIVGRFAPCLRGHVVEVGAGIGTFSRFILALPAVIEMTALEPATNTVDILRANTGDDPRVRVVHGYLSDLAASLESPVDAVVAVNVLEHVEDDAAFLHAAHDMLLPGGALLLFVPALPTLFGTLDAAFGHFRRYSKTTLAERVSNAGFQDPSLRYVNGPGTLLWLVAGRVFRRQTLDERGVRFYDRWILPVITRVERRWEPPLGQSILLIARKQALTL
jgi:SAM-dependent methyltransferase